MYAMKAIESPNNVGNDKTPKIAEFQKFNLYEFKLQTSVCPDAFKLNAVSWKRTVPMNRGEPLEFEK